MKLFIVHWSSRLTLIPHKLPGFPLLTLIPSLISRVLFHNSRDGMALDTAAVVAAAAFYTCGNTQK